ncbi:MAG: hypothetical protein II743_01265 [Lachnospiraceae bacterium]|nr:hypothetical protein [Lachnospiraceae bacterium]
MAKLILRCNYFKNEPARHKANYVKYLGTRKGVEFTPEQLPKAFWDDADMHGKKANYVDYLAERPGVVRVEGQPHGLFSEKGWKVNLERVMDEVAQHRGTVWINVISLKREDALRLGYDDVEKWQALLRSHAADVAAAFGIKPDNLNWYAAFHNEGHHPHVHLLVYSSGRDGYLTKRGIEGLKSAFVRDVFKDELAFLYDEKTKQRKTVKEKAGEELSKALDRLQEADVSGLLIGAKLQRLSKRLKNVKGKKAYGYLHPNIKRMVDDMLRDLEKVPQVKECYEKWMKWQQTIVGYYQDDKPHLPPLSENPEFKSVKNAVIKAALSIPDEASVERAETREQIQTEKTEDGKRQMALMTMRLMKYLEEIFEENTVKSQAGGRIITDRKQRAKENEKRRALGIKDGGGSGMTMSL